MNKRLKELRKNHLHLTQSEFGKRIGLTDVAISRYEKGERNITQQVFISICREFNVNENWLRTGDGEMFNESNDSLLQQVSSKYNLDDFQIKMVENFLKLDEPRRNAISDYIRSLIDTADKNQIDNEPKILPVEKKYPVLQVPARGSKTGYFEIELNERVKKALEADSKLNYEPTDDDF